MLVRIYFPKRNLHAFPTNLERRNSYNNMSPRCLLARLVTFGDRGRTTPHQRQRDRPLLLPPALTRLLRERRGGTAHLFVVKLTGTAMLLISVQRLPRAATTLDLLKQHREARALRRLRGSLEYLGRTTFGFFMDIGFSPRPVVNPTPSVFPDPDPNDVDAKPPPQLLTASDVMDRRQRDARKETRKERRDREWRERCQRRDRERELQRRGQTGSAIGASSASAPAAADERSPVATKPASATADAKATTSSEPQDDDSAMIGSKPWAELVQGDAQTLMDALDKAMDE